ncbi:hypothetical protein, partial [uncultured Granulicatella sp.]|uniref:hypothetical protein n=1 Tax=uncultured Granulicatella sp. TaxID=316089 RepID=UPI0026026731
LHIWFVFFVQFSKVNRCFATTLISYHAFIFFARNMIRCFLTSCATTFNNLPQEERDVNE